ncbi:hypothetical protein [Sporolactobacillus nakayamae]
MGWGTHSHFSKRESVTRLMGSVFMEINEKWLAGRRSIGVYPESIIKKGA